MKNFNFQSISNSLLPTSCDKTHSNAHTTIAKALRFAALLLMLLLAGVQTVWGAITKSATPTSVLTCGTTTPGANSVTFNHSSANADTILFSAYQLYNSTVTYASYGGSWAGTSSSSYYKPCYLWQSAANSTDATKQLTNIYGSNNALKDNAGGTLYIKVTNCTEFLFSARRASGTLTFRAHDISDGSSNTNDKVRSFTSLSLGKQSITGLSSSATYLITISCSTTSAANNIFAEIGFVYPAESSSSTYTATFDANGGSVTPASATQASAGASVSLPTPTRTGYTCNGWYTAASGGTKRGDAGGSYTPTASETLYAQWTKVAKTWCLAGEFNSWSTTANIFSDNTTSVELSAGQTYEFKINDGSTWFGNTGYMTCLYNQGWIFASTAGNCHVSATQAGTYTFTLDASDENNPKLSVTYPANPTIYLNPNDNWKQDGARFAIYAFYQDLGETKAKAWIDMTEDCGLYSADVPSSFPQIIICRMNPSNAENNWTNKWNQTADLNVPQDDQTQYTITDWGSGSWGVPTIPTYTISFDANEGTGTTTSVSGITCGSDATLTQNAFTRTGYTFVGWATSSTGSKVYDDKAMVENVTANITLYALWTESATPCFTMPDITSAPSDLADVSVTGGSLSDVSTDAAKAATMNSKGIKFGGNATRIKVTLNDATIVAGTTITLTYTSAYTDGTVSGIALLDGNAENKVINKTDIPGDGAKGSISHTFTADEAANYSNEFIITRNDAGKSVLLTGITVTHCGAAIVTHTITFDKNDGSSPAVIATQTGVVDNTATALKTISTIGWSRSGYTFDGWAETPDGSVVYANGANITISEDKTLYAKWTEDAPSACSYHYWFAADVDATDNSLEHNAGSFFSGGARGTNSCSGTISVNSKDISITKRGTNSSTLSLSFTIPDDKIATVYILASSNGSTARTITLSNSSDYTSTGSGLSSTSSSSSSVIVYEDLTPGTYSFSTSGNAAISFAAVELCDAGPTCTTPTLPDLSAQTICEGNNGSAWDVTPTNASTITAAGENISYSWKLDDDVVSTSATYQVQNASTDNGGEYTVTVTVSADGKRSKSVQKTVQLTVNAAAAITTQPAGQSVETGNSASLSVVATGTNLSYQWQSCATADGTYTNASGTSNAATYSVTPSVAGTTYYKCIITSDCGSVTSNVVSIKATAPCAGELEAPKIIQTGQTGTGACWTDITLKAVAQDGSNLVGGTYQWYKDDVLMSGKTSASVTVDQPGTYSVEYTKDACTVVSSNKAYVESKEVEVEKLAPLMYYRVGKSDYSAYMNARRLFTYKSLSAAAPTFTATRNGNSYAWSNLSGAVSVKVGENNVDTVLLSLNALASCGFSVGDEVVITFTPKDACGNDVLARRLSTTVYVVADKPMLALIVSGAEEENGTKIKKDLDMDGDFFTGYNKADLKKQDSQTSVTDDDLPLYTSLQADFNVVPVNGYAPFSKWNYEPFDILFLTDFIKTDGGSGTTARTKVNELGLLVDYRPMFSTKCHVQYKDGEGVYHQLDNWANVGFTAAPQTPKQTQKWMNIVCYAHPVFAEFLHEATICKETDSSGNEEVVFEMLTRGGYDSSKGVQGFKLSDVSNFVNIGTCHYNAVASVDSVNHSVVPTNKQSNDELLIASCERQVNINARLVLMSVNADAMTFLTDEGINVMKLSLKYLLESELIKVTDCAVTFLGQGATNTDWNTPANWNSGKVPTAMNNVRIAAPCVISSTDAVAHSVKILRNNTGENGSLTIAPTGALSLDGAISRIEGGAYLNLLPTHYEDVYISSSASGNGALIHADKGGNIRATVQMYSPASGNDQGNGTITDAKWQWMTTPFADAARAESHYYGSWMYTYDNATHQWNPQVSNTTSLTAFKGYCITQGAPTTYTMTGTLTPAVTTNVELYNGLNLIGNSWTAPIDITKMQASDFTNATATIFLFNTGLDVNGSGDVFTGEDGTTAGTYVSVPVESAGSLPSTMQVIPSMQAFEVKATADGSLSLNYDRIVRGTDAVNIQPMRAPHRNSDAGSDFGNGVDERLRISVVGQRYSDFLYLLRQSESTMGFDNGWDGEKIYSDNYDIPVIYVENADGDWQISTQPALSGTHFGFYRGEDQQTTVRFQYEGEEELWFYDSETDQYTLVATDSAYTFTSNTYDLERRFMLTDYNPKAPSVPTGIGDISPTGFSFAQDANSLIISHDGVGTMQVCVYDPAGRLLSTKMSAAPMMHIEMPLYQGAFLIDCKMGDIHEVIKVVR